MHTKNDIRPTMGQKRQALSSDEAQRRSDAVFRRLIKSDVYQKARCMACYVSVKNEVDTHRLIRTALKHGKGVGVPVTDHPHHMAFQAIPSLDVLKPVRLGLLEPPKDPSAVIPPRDLDLVLIPGLAFDRQGNRIGYGGGYFDRFLSTTPAPKAALAYDFQILDRIPTDTHDIRLNFIFTESGMIVC